MSQVADSLCDVCEARPGRDGYCHGCALDCIEGMRLALVETRRERDVAERCYADFITALTAKLNAAGVPAMPSWPDAIDWLIARGVGGGVDG